MRPEHLGDDKDPLGVSHLLEDLLRQQLGRSTAPERPLLTPDDYIKRTLRVLEITKEEVAGRTKRREVVRAREILISLDDERFGLDSL